MSGKRSKTTEPEVAFTPEEQEHLKQMGIEDPQNISIGDIGVWYPKILNWFRTAVSVLEKFGPLFERAAQQAQAPKE